MVANPGPAKRVAGNLLRGLPESLPTVIDGRVGREWFA
jgi:hypothetical protein